MTFNLPLTTFLFTDIEGSTLLWEQHPEAMQIALSRHDAILRQVIEAHQGCVFKTIGDAFCTTFSSALEALAAALAIQRALQAETWGGTPIKVRLALHTGPAEKRDHDYFGPSLNRVARLLSAGHGGQTLLSAATQELVRGQLPAGTELRDMGERRLKDLTRPEHIYQLLASDLPAHFPPLKTLDVFRTNLPAQLTSFVGREKEMTAVKRLIAVNRLTTLTGPGGTGKTRLSLQAASDLLDSFPDGVWLVEFAPLADPALVTQTVMSALGLHEETGRSPLDQLADYLRTKTALLILDNCEHLVEAVAQLAESLLQVCPNLRALVSSREVLAITGEAAYRVPSLSTPDLHLAQSVETVMQSEAALLFIERAQTAQPTFTITNENVPAIIQICTRLDGIPLAIELAAARVRLLTVEQIAEYLDDRFRLLTGGSRTALPRQQTLRALIDWSYDLLSEPERALLRRLSVFAGGWTLEAAKAIGQGFDAYEVFDLLTQLVNKSLIVVNLDEVVETRYRLLETMRQYAREKLTEAGESQAVRDQHLKYFLGLAERAEPELVGPRVVEWLQRLSLELDNLRAALEWSLKRDAQVGLRLASALLFYWPHNNDLREGTDWLLQLLRQPAALAPDVVRADGLTALGFLSFGYGGVKVEPFAREGLVIYRELGDQRGVAFASYVLGTALCLQNDFTTGYPLALESLALFRTLGDRLGIALVLGTLGSLAETQDYARMRTYLEESLSLSRELGYLVNVARQLRNLGELASRSGDYISARVYLTESLEIYRQLGSKVSPVVDHLGELAMREGDYEQARIYLEECLSVTQERGHIVGNCWVRVRLGYVVLREGNQARARSLFIEAQKGFTDVSSKIGVIYALEGLASLAILQGRLEEAARLYAWSDATRKIIGDARPPVEQADVDRELSTIQAQLNEAAFARAQAEGRVLTLEQAIATALESTLL